MLSNSRVTRIGNLLREGKEDAEVLTELAKYQSEFVPAYNVVVEALKSQLGLSVTGRFKTRISLVEKLKRGSSRLIQVQDIAGCRVIAASLSGQDEITQNILRLFPGSRVADKRVKPLHGYRAVHVIVTQLDRPVEVQIRTNFQHFWANRSEKLADRYGQEIKYGMGDKAVLAGLIELSDALAELDILAQRLGILDVEIDNARDQASKRIWKDLKGQRRHLHDSAQNTLRKIKMLISREPSLGDTK